jgi:hypothetical protein
MNRALGAHLTIMLTIAYPRAQLRFAVRPQRLKHV